MGVDPVQQVLTTEYKKKWNVANEPDRMMDKMP